MKTIAHAALLALALCGPAQARLVEIAAGGQPAASMADPAQPRSTRSVVVLQSPTSDLAEPQILAMMLLGLCLIGYKASRESSEKFK
ncbi:MAG: hypothetical protein ABWY27_06705 [Telluria sp.]